VEMAEFFLKTKKLVEKSQNDEPAENILNGGKLLNGGKCKNGLISPENQEIGGKITK
jgi:hypothetical protein